MSDKKVSSLILTHSMLMVIPVISLNRLTMRSHVGTENNAAPTIASNSCKK